MGKTAFVFSGQGAQYSGMGKELYEISDSAKEVFKKADKIRKNTSYQCFNAEKEELSQTINTQPCLFCVDLAAAYALKENGIIPDYIAGFSLGEIPALAFSGMLSIEDAFSLVCKRAEFMDECAKENNGEMYAVLGLISETVSEICREIEKCYPVNFNCKTQTVVAVDIKSSNILLAKIKENNGKAIKLSVSGAFHSPFMNKASENLKNYLKNVEIHRAVIPVFANCNAEIYNDSSLIYKQINSPVLWQKTIENMINCGVDTFIEVGAGKTLCGLISKIAPSVKILNCEDEKSLKQTLDVLKNV